LKSSELSTATDGTVKPFGLQKAGDSVGDCFRGGALQARDGRSRGGSRRGGRAARSRDSHSPRVAPVDESVLLMGMDVDGDQPFECDYDRY